MAEGRLRRANTGLDTAGDTVPDGMQDNVVGSARAVLPDVVEAAVQIKEMMMVSPSVWQAAGPSWATERSKLEAALLKMGEK